MRERKRERERERDRSRERVERERERENMLMFWSHLSYYFKIIVEELFCDLVLNLTLFNKQIVVAKHSNEDNLTSFAKELKKL